MPIAGIAGDQQAATIGQACFTPGMSKNTYGTGCFMLMNTGKKPSPFENGLLTTVAWSRDQEAVYALEGSVFIAGAAMQWLRDELQDDRLPPDAKISRNQVERQRRCLLRARFRRTLEHRTGTWTPAGASFGLTRGTTLARSISLAPPWKRSPSKPEMLDAMEEDSRSSSAPASGRRACANEFLMQFQADRNHGGRSG